MGSIRPQTVTLTIFAILFALMAASGAKLYLASLTPAQPPTPAKPPTAQVAVAQSNLTPETCIRVEDVATVEAPAASVPAGALPIAQRAVGRYIKSPVAAGHAIREEDLYEVGKIPTLADHLPPGTRALVLRVDDAGLPAGGIQPNSYVDIAMTYKDPDGSGMATERLASRVKVLATTPASMATTANFAATVASGKNAAKASLVVAVSPEQANRLTLAQQYGTLSVSLCSGSGEGRAVADEGTHAVDAYALLGRTRPVAEPPPVRKVSEVYHGTKLEQIVFNEAGGLLTTAALMSSPKSSSHDHGKARPVDCPDCDKKDYQWVPDTDTGAMKLELSPNSGAGSRGRAWSHGEEPQPTPAPRKN